MTATILIMPVIPRVHPDDEGWCEQFDRTCEARLNAKHEPPPRTRPLLVVRNESSLTIASILRMKQLFGCHRPEGER